MGSSPVCVGMFGNCDGLFSRVGSLQIMLVLLLFRWQSSFDTHLSIFKVPFLFYLPTKIFIKYRKHWKSYVSFQLSGQIRLIWAVKNHSPNWHQFFHERPMTVFKVILKKFTKSEKVGLPRFQTKKGMLALFNDWSDNFEMFFWCLRFPPKNERKQVNLSRED